MSKHSTSVAEQFSRWLKVREMQIQRGLAKLEAYANESDETKGDLKW